MRGLLHAVAALLTVLLLFFQPRSTFAAVCYKRFNIGQQFFQADDPMKDALNTSCQLQAHYMPPKYKRDPEIDIDNEEIGQYPIE